MTLERSNYVEGLIGAVLNQPKCAAQVIDGLSGLPLSPYETEARKRISELLKKNKPIDLSTVANLRKKDNGEFTVWLAKASDNAFIPSNLPQYINEVKEASSKKEFYRGLHAILQELIEDPIITYAEAREKAESLLRENPIQTDKQLVAVSLLDFLEQEHPPRINLLSPWLPSQGLCMIHAKRGVGKTHISCGVACAVAAGDLFLNWYAPEPAGVLLLDGEMPAVVLQERLQRIIIGMEKQPSAPLKIITPDNQKNGMPDLATNEGQQLIEEHISDDIKLIIVDNISTLVRTGRENDAEGWLPVQGWFLKLRAAGKSVLAIHHSNKTGSSRGTSKREDVLDTVMRLEHPTGYSPDQGACFEVHFEKNRGIYGDDVKSFEAKLTPGPNGEAAWAIRTLSESTYDKVVKLANEGLTQKEISDDLGIHKSNVSRHYKKGIQEGDIKHEES